MFDIRYILIIILLGIVVYMVYNMYSYSSNQFNKLKENLSEKITMEFEELNERIDDIEQLIEKRFNDNTKKIKDLCSLQNKLNEVNKMNSQLVINQINQYDEEIEENEENRDQIFNSVESSINKNNTNQNTNCFVKISHTNNNPKENFYMSPDKSYNSKSSSKSNSIKENEQINNFCKNIKSSSNTSDTSDTSKSSNSSKSSKSSNSSKSSKSSNSSNSSNSSKSSNSSNSTNSSKSSKSSNSSNSSNNLVEMQKSSKKHKAKQYDSEADADILLEIDSKCIKTNSKLENSPQSIKIKKSLGEFSNIVKNNSVNKFNSDDDDNNYNNDESQSENENINNFLNQSLSGLEHNDNNSEIFMHSRMEYDMDPPLLHPEIIGKINLLNRTNKNRNKIIDITS
jgi:hypothetical protein